ncbi:MAG TPA: sigma-70 family RNA polymerase sigma factor [Candidatus Angelobacter sp.]|nr:sigma-70 family RNA polymerase sigma factor [Candidatus Angelobacter sp.]
MMTRFQEARWGVPVTVESELTRLRGGDAGAVAAVMERYQHRLYRYLLRLLREPATAEDIFQQTWIKVMERIGSFDPSHSFEGWLFAVARNLAIDHLRRYRPESIDEPLPSGDSRAELIPGSGPGALEQVLAKERAAGLARAMAELPMVFREVLTLRFEEEMRLEEIAAVLSLPLGTVKTRLHRAMKHLRSTLESKSETLN